MRSRTVLTAAVTAYVLLGRRWQLQWGASAHELAARLPGDELVEHPDLVATRAITIGAHPVHVWPWLAQLGQRRGGFYSCDALENLAGCRIHSADRIVPGWQNVAVGDPVHLAPDVALTVATVEEPAALVLTGGVPTGDTGPPYDFSWAFVLLEQGENTRLVVRERYGYTRWWAPLLVELVEVVSFVMHQRMLRGIRDRVHDAVDDADETRPTGMTGVTPSR